MRTTGINLYNDRMGRKPVDFEETELNGARKEGYTVKIYDNVLQVLARTVNAGAGCYCPPYSCVHGILSEMTCPRSNDTDVRPFSSIVDAPVHNL